ncbi:hypothetical protein Tco_1009801 [Tanacetum coccineum]
MLESCSLETVSHAMDALASTNPFGLGTNRDKLRFSRRYGRRFNVHLERMTMFILACTLVLQESSIFIQLNLKIPLSRDDMNIIGQFVKNHLKETHIARFIAVSGRDRCLNTITCQHDRTSVSSSESLVLVEVNHWLSPGDGALDINGVIGTTGKVVLGLLLDQNDCVLTVIARSILVVYGRTSVLVLPSLVDVMLLGLPSDESDGHIWSLSYFQHGRRPERKRSSKEYDDMEVDIKEDENEPELTYPYEEVDPLNPPSPASESEPDDEIEVENLIESRDKIVPISVYEVGESSTVTIPRVDGDRLLPGFMRRDIDSLFGRMVNFSRRLCGRETAHALVEKKGKAKDKFYCKLILDLGNEVRSSVEQGTAAMEKLVKKLGNTEDKVECTRLRKELDEARFSNTFLRMQNERVERDLYWTRVRAHEFYQEMIHRGFVFKERPNEAINVLIEYEWIWELSNCEDGSRKLRVFLRSVNAQRARK